MFPRVIFASLLLACGSPVMANDWEVGEERETSTGTYTKLIWEGDEWRVWRFEESPFTSSSSPRFRCVAAKSANGRRLPNPTQFGTLSGGDPFLYFEASVARNGGTDFDPIVKFRGHHPAASDVTWRIKGARYTMPTLVRPPDLLQWDGQTAEVEVVTYRYPHIRQERVVSRGDLDLTGVTAAFEQFHRCLDVNTPEN